ncbi:MAG: TraR/DksA C4-type zinc finger protein [Anaerolineae bacterium]|jgi:RNA polymerase-binding transcription factor DksA|nr:TraR/DksA C4-type zinc finger protein [Anaerolineae bacterium]
MTTTKSKLYSELLDLHVTFRQKLEEMESAAVLDVSGTGYTNHQADDATMVYDQTVNASTVRSVKQRLRQIEEALARYEAGTYGICENCGREIDIARLEAIPYTSLCLRCAETRDYRAGI